MHIRWHCRLYVIESLIVKCSFQCSFFIEAYLQCSVHSCLAKKEIVMHFDGVACDLGEERPLYMRKMLHCFNICCLEWIPWNLQVSCTVGYWGMNKRFWRGRTLKVLEKIVFFSVLCCCMECDGNEMWAPEWHLTPYRGSQCVSNSCWTDWRPLCAFRNVQVQGPWGVQRF